MSMGGEPLPQRKMNTAQFTQSIRPKLRNMNTLAYEEACDFERKKGGSDKKRKELPKIFDDMELKESNEIHFGYMSPEKE